MRLKLPGPPGTGLPGPDDRLTLSPLDRFGLVMAVQLRDQGTAFLGHVLAAGDSRLLAGLSLHLNGRNEVKGSHYN